MTNPRQSDDAPRKAYYVERVLRVVTTSLVYADSAADARSRVHEAEWTDADDGRMVTFGKVRRASEMDR